ncbi:MAG: chemotaxis protein methyltransferase CheR, partial [Myxococcota bacterium]
DRHFDQADNGWRAKPHLRRRISVQKMNLLGRWTAVPRCDLILLRNVLIYFDEATKAQLLKRAHERLAQDGYLLLGGSELPAGRQPEFTRTRVGRTCVYQ